MKRVLPAFSKQLFIFSAVLFFTTLTTSVSAQLSTKYTFGQAAASTMSFIGGTSLGSAASDVCATGIPIGFSFQFNCNTYTTVGVSPNGFIWFGGGTVSGTQYTPLSSTTGETGAVDGIVAAFAQNVTGATSWKYQTTGTAPNRSFIVEWVKMVPLNSGGCDIQIVLNETTNSVQLRYADYRYSLSGNTSGQVGMRGNVTTDFLNRTGNGTWCPPSAGAVNTDMLTSVATSGCAYPSPSSTNQLNTFTYTYNPATCCTPPGTNASGFSFSNLNPGAGTADISFTRGTGDGGVIVIAKPGAVPTGPANGTGYTPANANTAIGSGTAVGGGHLVFVENGTGSGSRTVNLTGLTSGQQYSFAIYEYNATANCYVSTGHTGGFCFGPPATATVASSVNPVCSGSSSTLSLTGLSTGPYYTYQWQVSGTSGSGHTNASGTSTNSTYTTPTTLPHSPSYYVCQVTCPSTSDVTQSNELTQNVSSFLDCYCKPTFSQNNGGVRGITQVILNGSPTAINNITVANSTSPYYTLYTSPVADLSLSAAHILQVKVGSNTTVQHRGAAWIDYNQNGVFETSEYLGTFGPIGANATGTINFTVPGTATTGVTAMRVIGRFGTSGTVTSGQACAAFTGTLAAGGSGEVEDYRVNISAAPCSGTPTPGTVSVTTPVSASVCPGGTATLSISGQTTGLTGLTLQWKIFNGSSYVNVTGGSGATTTSYTTPALTNATLGDIQNLYKCEIGCTPSGLSDIQATPATVTVRPTPSITVNGSGTYSTSMCSTGTPSSVSLTATNAASGTTTYSWSPATGLSANNIDNPVATPATTTTYTVTGTANSCTATATAAITVNPGTVTFSPSAPTIGIGSGTPVTVSATSSNGGVTYAWGPSTGLSATTGATVTVNPLSATTYTVTATDAAGCSRTGSVSVTVNSGTPGTVSCGYSWSRTSNSWSVLTGATVLASGTGIDDVLYTNQPIGFTFDYNGVKYDNVGISSNGFIWFGSTNPTANEYNPISSSTAMEGVISVFGANMSSRAAGSALSIKTTGSVGSRVFTVEWNNWRANAGGSRGDYQVLLFESDYHVELRYNHAPYGIADAYNGQVGLRGASNADFNNRYISTGTCSNWDSNNSIYQYESLAGTTNTQTMGIDGINYACPCESILNACNWYPSSGVTYRWNPTVATPTISPSAQQNFCPGGSVLLTASTTMSSPSYEWQTYTYPPSNTAIVPAQTNSTYTAAPSTSGNYFYVVKVTNGSGCSRTSYATAVVVDVCTSLWIGPPNGDWHTAANWNPVGVPNSCAASVTIGNGTPVISSVDINVGDISIASGGVITLQGKNLNVCGRWTGGGGSNAAVVGSGTTYINSTDSAQIIEGNTRFDILEINNTDGVSLLTGANVSIYTGLHLQDGDLDVSNGTLTLLSTAADHNSYLDNFSSGFGGAIIGDVTAQRYVPVGGYNQHFISSPLSNAALSQIGASGPDGSYIKPTADCDETKSDLSSPYGSVFTYDDGHAAPGACMLGNWRITSAGNMAAGKGYSAYLTGNSTIALTGTPTSGDLTIGNLNNSGYPTVNTLQTQPIESGWNLVGNPYPSAIDLTTSRTGSGFGNQVQIWQTSGPFAGSWQPDVINGVAGHAIIPPFQAFMVLRTGAGIGSYPFLQAERTRETTQSFYRTASENSLQLEVNYNGVRDVTKVEFNEAATTAFDNEFDANKYNGSPGRPTLYTTMNTNTWYAINTLPLLKEATTVGMGLRPENNGTMTITALGLESFDATSYIYLEDKKTGVWHNLRNGGYTFATNKADAQQRFVLHFTPAATILTTNASCDASGMISIEQPGSATWNYTVTNQNSIVLASGVLNAGNPVAVSATPGIYQLQLTDNNNYTVSKSILVGGTEAITAAFTTSAATLEAEENLTFSSTVDAVSYNWNFGDGSSASGKTVNHTYTAEGVYNITLQVSNAGGCISTTTRSVTITSRSVTTGLNGPGINKVQIWSNENRVYVDFGRLAMVEAEIQIYNVIGQLLSMEKHGRSTTYSKEINTTAASYVIVKVRNENSVTTRKLFITNNGN